MWRAIARRDATFEGVFWFGVRTTGVFCRPGCCSRTPRAANVEFFSDPREALRSGYRACRKCLSSASALDSDVVRQALALSDEHLDRRLTREELRTAALDGVTVDRAFRRRYHLTFQEFHRLRRLGAALGDVRGGAGVLPTAIRRGYESESGFRAACVKLFRAPPQEAAQAAAAPLAARWLETPLGPMLALADDAGLRVLEFVSRGALGSQLDRMQRRLQRPIVPAAHTNLDAIAMQLEEYWQGKRREFDIPLAQVGTEFQQSVWSALRRIPWGRTRSYAWVAERIGKPSAVRAVAQANGANNIAIVIPCHRVIGADGTLTGYGGGLWRKRRLLEHEIPSEQRLF